MDKPLNMKHCGLVQNHNLYYIFTHNEGFFLQIVTHNMLLCDSSYLYALGKGVWKKWKKRYFILVQVSQYTFAMCSYKEKKSEPAEMLQLDGYTVDYIEPASGTFKFHNL